MVKTEQHKIYSEESPSSKSMASSSQCKKKYKGVRMRSWGSWVSEIRAPNQKTRIWLGSYSTPEAAARAYDAALLCLKGASANLNIPNSASSHYLPNNDTIMSPKSIQRVAAAAANSFIDNATTTTTTSSPPISPPLPSSSSSSSSIVSSPSDQQVEVDVSLMQSCNNVIEPISMMESSWYNFDDLQSPKYGVDQIMFNGVSFNPPTMEDFYEDGDIRLWSFC